MALFLKCKFHLLKRVHLKHQNYKEQRRHSVERLPFHVLFLFHPFKLKRTPLFTRVIMDDFERTFTIKTEDSNVKGIITWQIIFIILVFKSLYCRWSKKWFNFISSWRRIHCSNLFTINFSLTKITSYSLFRCFWYARTWSKFFINWFRLWFSY